MYPSAPTVIFLPSTLSLLFPLLLSSLTRSHPVSLPLAVRTPDDPSQIPKGDPSLLPLEVGSSAAHPHDVRWCCSLGYEVTGQQRIWCNYGEEHFSGDSHGTPWELGNQGVNQGLGEDHDEPLPVTVPSFNQPYQACNLNHKYKFLRHRGEEEGAEAVVPAVERAGIIESRDDIAPDPSGDPGWNTPPECAEGNLNHPACRKFVEGPFCENGKDPDRHPDCGDPKHHKGHDGGNDEGIWYPWIHVPEAGRDWAGHSTNPNEPPHWGYPGPIGTHYLKERRVQSGDEMKRVS